MDIKIIEPINSFLVDLNFAYNSILRVRHFKDLSYFDIDEEIDYLSNLMSYERYNKVFKLIYLLKLDDSYQEVLVKLRHKFDILCNKPDYYYIERLIGIKKRKDLIKGIIDNDYDKYQTISILFKSIQDICMDIDSALSKDDLYQVGWLKEAQSPLSNRPPKFTKSAQVRYELFKQFAPEFFDKLEKVLPVERRNFIFGQIFHIDLSNSGKLLNNTYNTKIKKSELLNVKDFLEDNETKSF